MFRVPLVWATRVSGVFFSRLRVGVFTVVSCSSNTSLGPFAPSIPWLCPYVCVDNGIDHMWVVQYC